MTALLLLPQGAAGAAQIFSFFPPMIQLHHLSPGTGVLCEQDHAKIKKTKEKKQQLHSDSGGSGSRPHRLSSDVKDCISLSPCAPLPPLLQPPSSHPLHLRSCSYAMTLNLDLLSLFCPGHKGRLFSPLSGLHGSHWTDSYKVGCQLE